MQNNSEPLEYSSDENVVLPDENSEEITSENVTEEIVEEEIEEVLEKLTGEITTEEILSVDETETVMEVATETVVYTTDPMVVQCLQIIICFLLLFTLWKIFAIFYKVFDFLF